MVKPGAYWLLSRAKFFGTFGLNDFKKIEPKSECPSDFGSIGKNHLVKHAPKLGVK